MLTALSKYIARRSADTHRCGARAQVSASLLTSHPPARPVPVRRYILLTRFDGELCPWCIASALLSFGIAALAVSGMQRRELQVRTRGYGCRVGWGWGVVSRKGARMLGCDTRVHVRIV